jgi:hypothetical protein
MVDKWHRKLTHVDYFVLYSILQRLHYQDGNYILKILY